MENWQLEEPGVTRGTQNLKTQHEPRKETKQHHPHTISNKEAYIIFSLWLICFWHGMLFSCISHLSWTSTFMSQQYKTVHLFVFYFVFLLKTAFPICCKSWKCRSEIHLSWRFYPVSFNITVKSGYWSIHLKEFSQKLPFLVHFSSGGNRVSSESNPAVRFSQVWSRFKTGTGQV